MCVCGFVHQKAFRQRRDQGTRTQKTERRRETLLMGHFYCCRQPLKIKYPIVEKEKKTFSPHFFCPKTWVTSFVLFCSSSSSSLYYWLTALHCQFGMSVSNRWNQQLDLLFSKRGTKVFKGFSRIWAINNKWHSMIGWQIFQSRASQFSAFSAITINFIPCVYWFLRISLLKKQF